MKLTVAQQKLLVAALRSAYPSPSKLKEFVRFELGVNLAVLATGDLSEQTFELFEWAQAQGRLRELVDKLVADTPDNPAVRDFAASLEAADHRADLDDLRGAVSSLLRRRPAVAMALTERLGAAGDALLTELFERRKAREVVEHITGVQGALGDPDDRAACRELVLRVLPAAADWQCFREEVGRAPSARSVKLPYHLEAIAEIVMAGRHNRACRFVAAEGKLPVGVGLIPPPGASAAPLFDKDGRRLLEHVVGHFVEKLGFSREDPAKQARYVKIELDRLAAEKGPARLRYYFVFHDPKDLDAPSTDALWELTERSLGAGLPQIEVARMNPDSEDDEVRFVLALRAVLASEKKP